MQTTTRYATTTDPARRDARCASSMGLTIWFPREVHVTNRKHQRPKEHSLT